MNIFEYPVGIFFFANLTIRQWKWFQNENDCCCFFVWHGQVKELFLAMLSQPSFSLAQYAPSLELLLSRKSNLSAEMRLICIQMTVMDIRCTIPTRTEPTQCSQILYEKAWSRYWAPFCLHLTISRFFFHFW